MLMKGPQKKKSFNDIQAIIRKNKKELKDRYGLKEVGIFGSYVRGEQDESSDVDLLAESDRTKDKNIQTAMNIFNKS